MKRQSDLNDFFFFSFLCFSSDFYAKVNSRNWIVSIITQDLMMSVVKKKKICAILKSEMKKRHIIEIISNISKNKTKLVDTFDQMKTIFLIVFSQRILKLWLEKCKLSMTRKINNTYKHCRNWKRRVISIKISNTASSSTRSLSFDETKIFVRFNLINENTLFHVSKILKK